jgi:hypothetical protein
MDKIFVCLCCALVLFGANAQQTNPANGKNLHDREWGHYYLKKKKQQNSVAWILPGAGTALLAVGTNIYTSDHQVSNGTNSSTGELTIIGGAVLSVISLPFFISAARNAGRAEVLLRSEKELSGLRQSKRLSLSVVFPLRK